ncbi:Hypothetical predicted protein [Lecanosticta acicola]|uniref:Uncharacterized protein n=1 Tax=Lecanosticta acicola TaxID=111012 RepID=A0AAI8YWE2_9PEZI|nr:Hypothetical predicted protein [Lecanosticta acicola]
MMTDEELDEDLSQPSSSRETASKNRSMTDKGLDEGLEDESPQKPHQKAAEGKDITTLASKAIKTSPAKATTPKTATKRKSDEAETKSSGYLAEKSKKRLLRLPIQARHRYAGVHESTRCKAAESKKAENTGASKIIKNVKRTTSNKSSHARGERILRKLDTTPPSYPVLPTPGTGYLADSEIEAIRTRGKAKQRGNSKGKESSRPKTSFKTSEATGGTMRSLLEDKLNTNAEPASKGLRSHNTNGLRRPITDSRHLSNISNVSVAGSNLNTPSPARKESLPSRFDVPDALPESPAKRSVRQNPPQTQKAPAREVKRMTTTQRQLFDTMSSIRQLAAGISNDLEELQELLEMDGKGHQS